jgi:hypothetical protein
VKNVAKVNKVRIVEQSVKMGKIGRKEAYIKKIVIDILIPL